MVDVVSVFPVVESLENGNPLYNITQFPNYTRQNLTSILNEMVTDHRMMYVSDQDRENVLENVLESLNDKYESTRGSYVEDENNTELLEKNGYIVCKREYNTEDDLLNFFIVIGGTVVNYDVRQLMNDSLQKFLDEIKTKLSKLRNDERLGVYKRKPRNKKRRRQSSCKKYTSLGKRKYSLSKSKN